MRYGTTFETPANITGTCPPSRSFNAGGSVNWTFVGAATEIGSPFFIDTSKGCAFTGVTTFEKGRTPEDPQCNDYFADTIDRLSAAEPGIVNQFGPRPTVKIFVCDCSSQPV